MPCCGECVSCAPYSQRTTLRPIWWRCAKRLTCSPLPSPASQRPSHEPEPWLQGPAGPQLAGRLARPVGGVGEQVSATVPISDVRRIFLIRRRNKCTH